MKPHRPDWKLNDTGRGPLNAGGSIYRVYRLRNLRYLEYKTRFSAVARSRLDSSYACVQLIGVDIVV